MSKSEQLNILYEEYKKQFQGEEIVLGDGNADSRLVLIGEAPGKDEVRLLKPFVGMAGKNLTEFLEILGLGRESIYITNAIKHRLSKVNSDTGRVANRPATKEEIKNNRGYLLKEISIIKPEFVVTLGSVPLKAVTGEYDISMGSVHGKLKELELSGAAYKLFPLYHPASIIYNRSLKDVYINDIKKLKDIVNS